MSFSPSFLPTGCFRPDFGVNFFESYVKFREKEAVTLIKVETALVQLQKLVDILGLLCEHYNRSFDIVILGIL